MSHWIPRSILFSLFICLLAGNWVGCGVETSRDIIGDRIEYDTVFPVPVSLVALPLRYEVRYFEQWLNRKISGKFLDRHFPVNEGRDTLWLSLTRAEPIRLALRNEKFRIDVPISAEGKFTTRVLGVQLSNREPVNAEMILRLTVDADLDHQWRLVTSTSLDTIIWVKDPALRIAFVEIDIKDMITRLLKGHESELLAKLDDVFHQDVNFRRPINKVWQDIQKPMHIIKQYPHAWLVFQPETVTGRIRLNDPEALMFDLSVELKAKVIPFSVDTPDVFVPLPNLIISDPSDSFNLVLNGSIPYRETSAYLSSLAAGQSFSRYGYTVMMDTVIMFGTTHGIALKSELSGDITGHVIVQGKPEYDPDGKTMHINHFRYEVNTSSTMVNTAVEWFHDNIMETLKHFLIINLDEYIDVLPEIISYAIDTGRVGDRISLTFKDLNFDYIDWLVSGNHLHFNIYTRGKARLDLEQLNMRRRLWITDP